MAQSRRDGDGSKRDFVLLFLAFAFLLFMAYVLGVIHRDDQPFAGRFIVTLEPFTSSSDVPGKDPVVT